ncbi:MAG: HemK2/MTQ2 family protein methyltransferase, partial [bacterium]
MIYQPREDSFLMQKYVRKYAKGLVLEIGTGSGILALESAKKPNVKKVLAVDIQKSVICHCKKNIKNKKITFQTSDLFSKIKTKFDTIIFNPPYLPEDIKLKDLTLDGGKKGYEILERFLNNANYHLKENGIILIIFSSLTKKEKIDEFIRNNLFQSELLEKEHIFFEDLYTYQLKKSDLLKKLEKKKVNSIKYFTHGHRGILFTGQYKKKKITIKAKLPESKAEGRIQNEIKWLKILNKHKIGPKLLFHEKDFFIYEFIKGIFITPYIKKSKKAKITQTLKNIFKQLHIIDKLKVDKEEMHHPFKHIIIDKKPVLLDFERCHKTKKPKNLTQFLVCLIRKD